MENKKRFEEDNYIGKRPLHPQTKEEIEEESYRLAEEFIEETISACRYSNRYTYNDSNN